MSIEVEHETVTAICDQCGERRVLDIASDDQAEVADALTAIGWYQFKPAVESFHSQYSLRPIKVLFPQDFCEDCRDGEPRPKPKMGSGRRAAVSAALDDPCDEWARAAVFAFVGLRETCGHPHGAPKCPWCEAGYPAGRTDQRWRR